MNNNKNIFEEVERERILAQLEIQKEMLKGFDDVLVAHDINNKTGKLTRDHLDECAGCSLCER